MELGKGKIGRIGKVTRGEVKAAEVEVKAAVKASGGVMKGQDKLLALVLLAEAAYQCEEQLAEESAREGW